MDDDEIIAAFETRAAPAGAPEGTFTGYGSVFNQIDGHGDTVSPGAFRDSIERRTRPGGGGIAMHVMHGFFGGDGLPGGVWKRVSEDSTGLHVEGKISGMNTDKGRHLFELVKDGALGGLSIGFKAQEADRGGKSDAFKRNIRKADVREISLVDEPSNAASRVNEIRSVFDRRSIVAPTKAINAIVSAMSTMSSAGNNPTKAQSDAVVSSLQDAHEALTGSRTPSGIKSADDLSEAELRSELAKRLGIDASVFDTLPNVGDTRHIPRIGSFTFPKIG